RGRLPAGSSAGPGRGARLRPRGGPGLFRRASLQIAIYRLQFAMSSDGGHDRHVRRFSAHRQFVYYLIMNVTGRRRGATVASIAAAIGVPARARMLDGLIDGHARTSTELALAADVSPPTASAHLHRLQTEGLVSVVVQGKHRYYRLASADVA